MMASKATATFNFLLVSIAITLASVARLQLAISTDMKRSLGYPEDSLLNFTQLTVKYGCTTEEHTVTTEDGYLLTVFRVTGSGNCKTKKKEPPVILMHGLLQSSDAWIDAGPSSGLAYLLSDACYDLWVGNQRGNYYSRRHEHLNPDKDAKFWDFSVDEIGLYDIPATIDYVLNTTGHEKLNYVGYSQGSGTVFIMCSEKPGYCDKIQLLINLAPAARQTNTKSVLYRTLTESIMITESLLSHSGIQEVFSKGAISEEFLAFICQIQTLSETLCGGAIGSLDSSHPGSIDAHTLQVMFGHFPAGTSLRNMARYGQSMLNDNFVKYDYGKSKNVLVYGSELPPKYNLSTVTVPTAILYGNNDHLVDPKDVKWLVKQLPNVIELFKVDDPLWNHMDMTYSHHVTKKTFPKVNEYLNKYSL